MGGKPEVPPEPSWASLQGVIGLFVLDAPMSSGFSKFLGMSAAEGVSEHGAVDRVGEVALEDAHGLPLGVPT